jgi:anti-sigma factor RsiW
MSRRNPLTRLRRSTVDCRAVGRWIQSYVDDELEPDRRGQIAEHLEACRRCGLELSTYREVKASLGRERPEVAPDALDRLRRFGAALAEGPSVAD